MTAKMYGYNPPFIGGPQNILSRQEDTQLIKNDILQLLLTIPGERVMRPDFGVNLRNAVFEPGDEATVSALEDEIREAILNNEPRVDVLDVVILTNTSTNMMNLQVSMVLRDDPLQRIDIEQFIGFNNGP